MRKTLLLFSFIMAGTNLGFGQNTLAGKTLYTLPLLNVGISMPPYEVIPKDHFRLGVLIEGFKVDIWHQTSSRLGFEFAANAVYYEGFELKFREWVSEQIPYGWTEASSWMLSPQVHGALTYFLTGNQRYFLYASAGVVYKFRRWKALPENLEAYEGHNDNVSSGLKNDGRIFESLWDASVTQVSPFIHGRFGFNLVFKGRVLHVFKAWYDVYPAYEFQYKFRRLRDGEWTETTATAYSKMQGVIGMGIEFHGILGKGFGAF